MTKMVVVFLMMTIVVISDYDKGTDKGDDGGACGSCGGDGEPRGNTCSNLDIRAVVMIVAKK